MILADSSVWVDLLRGTGRGQEFASLLRSGAPICSTEPVLMELLAGTRSDREYGQVRSLVASVEWRGIDPAGDFESAAGIYRDCRRSGVTPRGLTDCLIAAVAIRTHAQVMSADRDFKAIAAATTLTVI